MVVTHSRLTLDRSRAHHRSLLAFCSSDGAFQAVPLPPLQLSRKRQSPFARLRRWLCTSLWCAALLALASALAWGWFTIAAMTGTMTAAGADSLLMVLRETSFGQVWVARLALLAGLLTLMRRRSNAQPTDWTIMLLAALIL